MPGDAPRRSHSASGARRRASAVLGALAVGVLGACGATDEGRTLDAPSADQTTTTTVEVAAVSGSEAGPEPLRMTSTAVTDGGELPVDHTCRGRDVSPPLQWTGVPSGTVELAVVVRDIDAGLVHWAIAGLRSDAGGIAEGTPPEGAVEATNDLGRAGWSGACPTSGMHSYEIRVFALAEPSGITAGQPGADAAAQIEAAPALMTAVLSATATATADAG